jgi:hypothetical protein
MELIARIAVEYTAAIGAVATGLQIPPGALGERLAAFDGRGRLADAGKSYTQEF